MKKLAIFIVSLTLISCGYDPIDYTKPVIVSETAQCDNTRVRCYYYTRDVKSERVSNIGQFCDKCGKFTVGDTIYVARYKRK